MGDGVKSTSDKLHYYAYSTIKAPDKGEVGGSSPPRPTIQITNIYAAILTFPVQGTCHQKTVLPKISQKSSRPYIPESGAFASPTRLKHPNPANHPPACSLSP